MYDLIIKNGTIIDGTGGEPYRADLAIRDGKIACIAPALTGGGQVIDATGLTVTPGFIDSHSHADENVLKFPDQIEKVEQGITTSIGGQCGCTKAPFGKCKPEYEVGDFGKASVVYKTMGTFLDTVAGVPLGANLAAYTGHCALRSAVIGPDNREPTPNELEKMAELLREGMDHGALGISFGLIYPPSCYGSTEELIYLAKVAVERGGMIAAHIRDEGDRLVEACQEFLQVAKATGARAVFSHHKAMGRHNWGKVQTTLAMLDDAVSQGHDIYLDVYPYTASNTLLSSRFIPRAFSAGGNEALAQRLRDPAVRERVRQFCLEKYGPEDNFSWALITSSPGHPEFEGLRVNEAAALLGKDVYETVCDIVADTKNRCYACYFLMCEEDVETVLAHPRCMICTDNSVAGNHKVYHPRLRGSFPRALGHYVRERGVVSLPEMIRKMTSLPARVYGLAGKGVLKEGFDADICIFDADVILDKADYTACHERAVGLNYVLLGGKLAAENAVYTGQRNGKLLR